MFYKLKICIVFLLGFASILYITEYLYKKKLSKRAIKFNEFDDVEKILKQEKREKEQLVTDWEILNRVARKDLKNFRAPDSVKVESDKIHEGAILTEIKENGNNFDTELFKKWCKEIFRCIKSGTEEELEAVKYFMTEEMYDRLIFQTKQFEKDGLDFVTENLVILDSKLLEYGNWLDKEEIKVLVRAKMKEYIVQKSTKKILRGSNKKSYTKEIVMTFLKQNVENKEGFLSNCTNCGAETTQTSLGRCKYCDTLVFPIRYNWTLIKFETK